MRGTYFFSRIVGVVWFGMVVEILTSDASFLFGMAKLRLVACFGGLCG